MNLEELASDFSLNIIYHKQFVISLLLATLLSFILSWFYKRFGQAISNRHAFADNFVLLTLTTMLIIYIVKSSIALSLGLVGALSIVRFRAAIKDPEELVYLFMAIAIGLGMGAEQPGITTLAFILIMSILFILTKFKNKPSYNRVSGMHLNIASDKKNEGEIKRALLDYVDNIKIKRMSNQDERYTISYLIEVKEGQSLSQIGFALEKIDENIKYSFIDNSNLSQ